MRRFLRPIVIAVASLGLALGVGFGIAAPALADAALTGGIVLDPSNPLIVAGTATSPVLTPLVFSGTKDATSTITRVSINNPAPTVLDGSDCQVASDSIRWSCSYTPPSPGFVAATGSTIEIDYTNSDGSPSQSLITFDVVSDPETSPAPAPYVVPTYHFTPNGVDVTATPTDPNDYASIQFRQYEGEVDSAACPGDSEGMPFPGDITPGTQSCSVDLGTSLWVAQAQQGSEGDGVSRFGNSVNNLFYVPEAPEYAAAVPNSERTVAVSGEIPGESDVDVVVMDQNGTRLCTSHVVPGRGESPGTWACTTSVLPYGTTTLSAVGEDLGAYTDDVGPGEYYVTGGLSAAYILDPITFTAPVVPGPGDTTPGDTTPTWSFTIGGDLTDVHPGDTLDISGSGLPAGTSLDTILHSVPTDLGAVVAAADGTFAQTVTIPTDTELGAHTILVTASGAGITTTTKQQAITVTAVPASAGSSSGSSGKSDVTTTKPTATHDAGDGSGTGIAPNILTRALTPFADIAVHPNKIISAFEIGLVLLLLAVLPAHLLNATIAEQSERFERRFPKLHAPRWLTTLIGWFRSAPVVGGIVVTLATAILFGFADPKFGFTLASLRLILACGIALFLVGYVANWLTGVIAHVQWNIVAAVSTRPYGLILTIVGVLISRLLDFSPGFLIGLILGLTIQGKSAAGFAWRTVVLRSSIVLIMAIAAWIGYSTITLGGDEGGTFGSALLVETLVAITTEGVVALLVELLPLRFLEGERIYAHSRVLWGIFYILTLVVFVLAVVPWEGNWDALGSSLWIWVGVLALFALVCVGVYIYFRRFAKPLEEEAGEEKVALGESVGSDQ